MSASPSFGAPGDVCVERFNAGGALYNEAQLAKEGKPKAFLEAAKAFESYIERATNCPDKEKCEAKDKIADGYFYLGASYCEAGSPAKAIASLETLIKQYPSFTYADKARYFLGKALFDTNDFPAAAAAFAELAKRPKSDITDVALYWEGESRFRIAEKLRAEKKDAAKCYDEAAAVFQKLIADFEISSRRSDALYSLGWCRMANQRWKDAVDAFQSLAKDKRYGEESLFRCGECTYSLKDYAGAANFYEQVRKLNGKFYGTASLGKGWALFYQAKYAEAATPFEQAIAPLEKEGESNSALAAEARLALAECLERQGNDPKSLQKAIEVLAPVAAKKLDISDDALYLTALAHYKRGGYDEAKKTILSVVQLYPESNVITESRLLLGAVAFDQAEALQKAGKGEESRPLLEEAAQAYDAIIAKAKDHKQAPVAYQKSIIVLYSLKKHQGAIDRCREFLQRNPESPLKPFFLFAVAENQLALGKGDEAGQTLQLLLDSDKEKSYIPNALYRLGFICRDKGEYEKASANFLRLSKEFPQHALAAESAYLAAIALLDAGKYPEAYTLFTDFGKNHAGDSSFAPRARINAGVCLSKQKKFKEARTELEEIYNSLLPRRATGGGGTRKPPTTPPPVATTGALPDAVPEGTDLLLYELAWACRELGDNAAATKYFDLLLGKQFENSPYKLDATFESANASYDQKNYDEAIEKFRRIADALSTDKPGSSSAHRLELLEKSLYRLAWSCFKKEQYGEAEKNFSAIVERFPKGTFAAESSFMAGESAMRNPTFAGEKARERFQKTLDAYPSDKAYIERSLFRLGDCLAKMGLWDESLQTYQKLIEQFPAGENRSATLYGIGLAHQKLGKIEEAIASFEKAKSEDGGKSDISPKSQFMIGEILFQQKKFEESVTAFKLVWMRYANAEWSSRSLFEAAKAQRELKQWKEAVALYERLIKEFPASPQASEAKKEIEGVRKLIGPVK